MAYVITQSCCNDTSCVEACPVDCIHPTPGDPDFATAEMLYINPDDCIDCGACVEACPVGAIHADLDVPDHLAGYLSVNEGYFAWMGGMPDAQSLPRSAGKAQAQTEPLRVAVIGAGPSGWFAAGELATTRRADVEVTLLERLVTPTGLVRHGVAPDHLSTKGADSLFRAVAANRKVTLRLGVSVGAGAGTSVTHEELLQHHHAVIHATGAPHGRITGTEGEGLPGSLTGAELVAWYNGHPDQVDLPESAGLTTALAHDRVVVVGNGNVALDIARLLLADEQTLLASDMAPAAVEALAASGITEVVVLGRRGAEHAAFTSPELQALIDNPTIDVVVDEADLASLPSEDDLDRTPGGYARARKAQLLQSLAGAAPAASKRIVFRFGQSVTRIVGEARVEAVEIVSTSTPDTGSELLAAGLVVTATGFRSVPVPGVPFDEQVGRFTHERGRVLDPATEEPVPGVYATGWSKRGPQGVIGTNRACAAETVDSLLDDFVAGLLPDPAADRTAFDVLLKERDADRLSLPEWTRLDKHEQATGRAAGRPRLKVVDPADQRLIALGRTQPTQEKKR